MVVSETFEDFPPSRQALYLAPRSMILEAAAMLKSLCLSFSLPENGDDFVFCNPARLMVGSGNGIQTGESRKYCIQINVC